MDDTKIFLFLERAVKSMMQKVIILIIGMLGILLNSCGILSPVDEPQIKQYQLTLNLAPDTQACAPSANAPILQISPVKVYAPYDTRNMYYSESPYQLSSYAFNQWSTMPEFMFNQAILQKLIATCIYSNVVNAEVMSVAKHRLVVQVMDFKQVISAESANMNFTVLAQLIDNKTNAVIKSKTFAEVLPVSPDPQGYVRGANDIVLQFVNDLADWLAKS